MHHTTGSAQTVSKGLSLHLSLTDWRVPVPQGAVGLIDQDGFLTEGVVSVHNQGRWYADIDVLRALEEAPRRLMRVECECDIRKETGHETSQNTSIDSFDELLDPSNETPGVVRAYNNWAARLATFCIVFQKINEEGAFIIDKSDCVKCSLDQVWAVRRTYGNEENPTIVID